MTNSSYKTTRVTIFSLGLGLSACGGSDGTTGPPLSPKAGTKVAGTMSFVLGATSGSSPSPTVAAERRVRASVQSGVLVANDEYVVSPRKAKITFASVTFRGASGETLGESSLGNCALTYDRSLPSGTTLLNCPFTAPVGDVYQIAVYYNKSLELLVSDAAIGIYSTPASPTGFSTSAPAAGATFVPFTIVIGDNSTTRATPIIFPSPVSIAAGSSPTLYITTDMIHTLQLRVDVGGNTLTPKGAGVEGIALFGGATPGSSRYYSNANTIEALKAGSIVQGLTSVRIFYDQAGSPLFLMGQNGCGTDPQGVESPKSAWASPPLGATIGGWLGKDSNKNIAWAVPTTSSYSAYSAYFIMAEQTVVGQSTNLMCKATASPPPPADGKTYASGAPAMPTPDTRKTLMLLAK